MNIFQATSHSARRCYFAAKLARRLQHPPSLLLWLSRTAHHVSNAGQPFGGNPIYKSPLYCRTESLRRCPLLKIRVLAWHSQLCACAIETIQSATRRLQMRLLLQVQSLAMVYVRAIPKLQIRKTLPRAQWPSIWLFPSRAWRYPKCCDPQSI
jgi:hypothetical protein